MTEICQNPYNDPAGTGTLGPPASEVTNPATRNLYDGVGDYNGWTESPPEFKNGTTIPNFTGWTRSVVVAYLNPSTMATSSTDLGIKQVTVTVTDPRGSQTVLTSLRCSGGQYDTKPVQQETCVRWVGVQLQVGSDARYTVYSGTGVPNIVP